MNGGDEDEDDFRNLRLPTSLAGWLRLGLIASITGCVFLLFAWHDLKNTRWPPKPYVRRAEVALLISIASLFLFSLALLPLNWRLGVKGIIAAVLASGLYLLLIGI